MSRITESRIRLNMTATNLGHPAPNTDRENTLKQWVKLAT